MCNVIGQGIFLKTSVMTCAMGSPTSVLGVWLLAGLLSLCGALTVAELGAMMPRSGGTYVFLRRAYGPVPAFAFGWMSFWVLGPAAIAALGSGAAIFLNAFSGGALNRLTTTFTPFGAHAAVTELQWGALILIASCVAINLAPVGLNGRIATVLSIAKLSLLLAALYAYQGLWIITSIGGEIKNPGRVIPLALWSSAVVIILCYLLVNTGYFFAMTPRGIAGLSLNTSIAVEVMKRIFGGVGQEIAGAVLFISTIAALHTTILTESRTTYALTRDGVLFPGLGVVAPRWHVPARAVLAIGVIAAVLAMLGSFETLTNYFIFNVWLFNIATIGGVNRRRHAPIARGDIPSFRSCSSWPPHGSSCRRS